MSGIRGIDDVDRAHAAGVFLADALEVALRAGTLHPHLDAFIFRLERPGDPFSRLQLHRGVVGDRSFLAASINCGVTAVDSGAAALIGEANNVDRQRTGPLQNVAP